MKEGEVMTYEWGSFDFTEVFEPLSEPKLILVGEEDSAYTKLPRAMHKHDDRLEILLVLQGGGLHTIDGELYQTAKGDILLYNSGALHHETSDSEVGKTLIYCAVSGLQLKGLPPNCIVPIGKRPVVPSGDAFDDIESLMKIMYQHAEKRLKDNNAFISHLLKALITRIYYLIINDEVNEKSKEWELGQAVRAYIDVHYMENLTLEDMAEHFRVSQYYLAHVFKTTIGIPPIQYVIRRKIGEAQSYLLYSDDSIAEIAEKLGYNNVNHFQYSFNKYVGISPGKYRKYWKLENE